MILDAMTKEFAPILAFTCNEIWLAMPHRDTDDARNVVLNEMTKGYAGYALSAEKMAALETALQIRGDVNGVLETARADKRIGKALEAQVVLSALDAPAAEALKQVADMKLAEIFIVSDVKLADAKTGAADAVVGSGSAFPGLTIEVLNAPGTKCPRCWMHSLEANEEGLCPRCAAVMKTIDVEL